MQRSDVFDQVRPQLVHVTCASLRWQISLHTAHDWIGAVGFDLESLAGVFPGSLVEADVEPMFRLSRQLPDIENRWRNCARVALGRGSGRDWWWSLNLIGKALRAWPYINGKLLLHGVRAAEIPLPDWLDACYMLLWQHSEENDRIKLDLELSTPPAGVAIRRSRERTKQMLADFAAD